MCASAWVAESMVQCTKTLSSCLPVSNFLILEILSLVVTQDQLTSLMAEKLVKKQQINATDVHKIHFVTCLIPKKSAESTFFTN